MKGEGRGGACLSHKQTHWPGKSAELGHCKLADTNVGSKRVTLWHFTSLGTHNLYITMTSWGALWRLKSPASLLFTQPFIQAQIKVTGEFPVHRASYAENVSIWWRHHDERNPDTWIVPSLIQYVLIQLLHHSLIEPNHDTRKHYSDVIMGGMASQITSVMIVYSAVYSGADQWKHQSSSSLAFVWGIHRWPVNSPHKWPVTRKMFPFDDVIMKIS